MPPPIVSAKQFLEALYEGVGAGFIEIRPLLDDDDPRKNTPDGRKYQFRQRKFFRWPEAIGDCVKYIAGLNGKEFHLYFGVALRKNTSGGGKNDVGCCTAVFADIDFKDIEPEEARKLLSEFPFKPSIIVKSGNGLHVYWLLKEPVVAGDFPKLEAINRGMLKYMRAQIGPQDVSRILRLPGTLNIKKKYPNPKPVTTVTWFHPENRYILDDFEQYLPQDAAPAPKTYILKAQNEVGKPSQDAPGKPQDAPTFDLDEETVSEVANLLKLAWIDGYRHYIALHVAGWCAHQGYSQASAESLITHICDLAKDPDIADRLNSVRDSYGKFMSGQKVSGFTTLEKMVRESLPELIADKVVKVIGVIKKSTPKAKKSATAKAREAAEAAATAAADWPGDHTASQEGGAAGGGGGGGHGGARAGAGAHGKNQPPNFHLVKAIKFMSSPPRYQVIFEKDGAEHIGACEGGQLLDFKAFKALVFQQTDLVLSHVTNKLWDQILGDLRWEHREAPVESSPEGAIDSALNEFLQEGKENPDLGLLKSFPGYDESSTFFRSEAFKDFLGGRKLKYTDPQVYDRLRTLGWDTKEKRFGRKTHKVWYRAATGDPGEDGGAPGPGGNGNGHHPPGDPKPKSPDEKPPATDLTAPGLFPGLQESLAPEEPEGFEDQPTPAEPTKEQGPSTPPTPSEPEVQEPPPADGGFIGDLAEGEGA